MSKYDDLGRDAGKTIIISGSGAGEPPLKKGRVVDHVRRAEEIILKNLAVVGGDYE